MNSPAIEVIIWDPVGYGASSMGHVSVNITRNKATTSYSLAPGGCDVKASEEYLGANTKFRTGYGLTLRLTDEQADAVAQFFEKKDWCDYSLLNHNCTAPIQEALQAAGMKLTGNPIFPRALGLSLWNNGFVRSVMRYDGPKSQRIFVPPWSNTRPGSYPWERSVAPP